MTDTIKSPNLTLRYSFIQGFYWMNFSAIMGFASLYLLDSGFSNTEIGMIMAVPESSLPFSSRSLRAMQTIRQVLL